MSNYQIETADFGNAPTEMYDNYNMPAGSINPARIMFTKTQIASLLNQIEPGIVLTDKNIDSVIQQQMEKRNITPTFNPTDTNITQFQQLTALLTALKDKLEQEKKGGKKQKSKRYRKSRKQRKTKTKRRLRRSYK